MWCDDCHWDGAHFAVVDWLFSHPFAILSVSFSGVIDVDDSLMNVPYRAIIWVELSQENSRTSLLPKRLPLYFPFIQRSLSELTRAFHIVNHQPSPSSCVYTEFRRQRGPIVTVCTRFLTRSQRQHRQCIRCSSRSKSCLGRNFRNQQHLLSSTPGTF